MSRSLAELIGNAPLLKDEAEATRRLDEAGLASLALQSPGLRLLLLAVADHSPYLWRLASSDIGRLADIVRKAPTDVLEEVCESLARVSVRSTDDEAMRALRLAKQSGHLLIALCALGDVWDVSQVTAALTALADASVSLAVRVALIRAHQRKLLQLADEADPEAACGLVILALGKHGAHELNFSSDIDLIAIYDGSSRVIVNSDDTSRAYVFAVRLVVKLLQELTSDGYAFRVDLRLRPDPSSTPVAVSTAFALQYYEVSGQNWERAALIKARPVAGQLSVGDAFLAELTPFIWRRYFDFAAIADIHAMKRQIHMVRGFEQVAVAGQNIKLGRGGIREVEFFVQTQQLIFGGRRPQLRGAQTLPMLAALQSESWITSVAAHELQSAYCVLRDVEHRLQMRFDEQTQRLPADEADLHAFSRFCGFESVQLFSEHLMHAFAKVIAHYSHLFEADPELALSAGNLVFTGVDDDPETLETLARLGFSNPARIIDRVRGWHFGRYPSMRSARAREELTALVPSLIEAFSQSGDPEAAFASFDVILERTSSVGELLAILRANKNLRDLFVDILGGAPRLAQIVCSRPHVLDAAVAPANLQLSIMPRGRERLVPLLAESTDSEAFMDECRDIAHEEMFSIGLRILAETWSAREAGLAFTGLAEDLTQAALQHAQTRMEADYGKVSHGRVAILGMGRLGSKEMTAASDLDLIMIFDFSDADPQSSGIKSLHAEEFYARLMKRLVALLTASTRRGKLYDVDLRLRPSGRQGPIATRVSAFRDYQINDAEFWEHMALTRMRAIAGDPGLMAEAEDIRRNVLRRKRDDTGLSSDVRKMRRLIAKEKPPSSIWDIKTTEGGLIDIEFIAQYLVLNYSHGHETLMHRCPSDILQAAMEAGLLTEADGQMLLSANAMYQALIQCLRLCVTEDFTPEHAREGVRRRIASSLGLPTFGQVEAQYNEFRPQVAKLFQMSVRSLPQAAPS